MNPTKLKMKFIKELLINPSEAIVKAKKKKDVNKVSVLLLVEWLLIGLSIIIVFSNLACIPRVTTAATAFLIGIPSTLFFALLLKIVMRTLGGKGNYYEGLVSIAYGLFAISLGVLISSLFFYVPSIGFLFGLLILIMAGALSISTFYRAVKELFDVDMITTWVGIGLSAAGIVIGIYIMFILVLGGTPGLFQALETMRMWNI